MHQNISKRIKLWENLFPIKLIYIKFDKVLFVCICYLSAIYSNVHMNIFCMFPQ